MFPFLPTEGFVSGGILLIVFGAILAYFRSLPSKIWGFIERHLFVSLHVFDNDESFNWIKIWLGEKLKNTKSKSVFTRSPKKSNSEIPEVAYEENNFDQYKKIAINGKDRRPQPSFIPAPNLYFFWFKGILCWVNYERKETESPNGTQRPRESFTIRCITRKLSVIEQIVDEARSRVLPIDDRIEVRTASMYCWELAGRVDSRSIDSVVLPDDIPKRIVEDIRNFQDSKKWYSQLGIPYRRGFLLYGPPGGGKSSLVLAVASELGLNVNVLVLSHSNINDGNLQELINRVEEHGIILIEDIDSCFDKRKKKDEVKSQSLTFSGVLNALDGLGAQGSRILFMTTNKIDELDPALIRPGRADVRIYIPHATRYQVSTLFKRFHPTVSEESALAFADKIPENKISMASIQGHLLKNRFDPEKAIATALELVEEERKIVLAQKSKVKNDEN